MYSPDPGWADYNAPASRLWERRAESTDPCPFDVRRIERSVPAGPVVGAVGMQPEEIRQVLLDILAGIVPDEDLSSLRDEVPFREQIELDSMDFLDIVMELRKQYRVQIPEEDYPQLATMGGAVKYLVPLMKDVKAHA